MLRRCYHCGELISQYATIVHDKTYHNECYKYIDTKKPPIIQRVGGNDKKGNK